MREEMPLFELHSVRFLALKNATKMADSHAHATALFAGCGCLKNVVAQYEPPECQENKRAEDNTYKPLSSGTILDSNDYGWKSLIAIQSSKSCS